MTTTIKIEPGSHSTMVTITDNYTSPGGVNAYAYKQEVILSREHGGQVSEFYITNTRSLNVSEMEADCPAEREARGLAPRAETPHPLLNKGKN